MSEPSMPSPGVEHQRMEPFVGAFRATVKISMGPGDPVVTTGRMVNSWRLGGLYLEQDYQGDAVDGPYPAFCGRGYWGFSSSRGCYEGFWIDNASPAMQLESGEVDSTGKVWTMRSEFVHPQTNDTISRRSVITLIDDDRHTMDSYISAAGGDEQLTMQIEYVREA